MEHLPTDALQIELQREPGSPPVHLQIQHSLEYAIGFGQIPPGAQLPSVRALAAALDVAPNTVSRAYRELQEEGLVVARPGRGTFIDEFVENKPSRRSALREILRPALRSAQTVGFPRSEILHVVRELLSESVVAFIGVNQIVVDKWVAILEREFSDLGVRPMGLTLDELRRNPEQALAALRPAHHIFTLVTTYAEVQALLGDRGKKVSTLLSELSVATHERLARLPGEGVIGLVCRDFYVSSLMGVLSAYVDLNRLRRVLPEEEEGLHTLFEEAACVVHTFASSEKVRALAPSEARLIELEFVPNRAHFQQLRSMLK